jgi:hypothetical protein
MDLALRLLRSEFADRPIGLFLLLLPALMLLARRGLVRRPAGVRPVSLVVSAGILVSYLFVVAWYAHSSLYFDHAEPTITAVAWLLRTGQPIYHGLDSAERYSLIYGPAVFLLHAAVLAMAGPGIVASKSAGAGAALLGVMFVFVACARAAGWRVALALTATSVLVYLGFRNATFWTRPEPFILLSVAIGLAAVGNTGRAFSTLTLGLAAGLALDLKFTGVLYLLPPFALLGVRHGWRSAATALGLALVVAALPFVLMPQVSPANYLLWIRMSGQNGLQVSVLEQNVEFALLVVLPLVPLMLTMTPADREPRAFLAALAFAVPVVGLLASKPGGGPLHLVPFLPSVLYGLARWGRWKEGATAGRFPAGSVAAYLFTFAVVATVQQWYFIQAMQRTDDRAVVQDIEEFQRSHQGKMAIGYTGEVPGGASLSLYRPLLVFAGNDYWLDAAAIRENQLSRLPFPAATIGAMRTCRERYWLIPQGGDAFDTRNMYPTTENKPLFPDEFRRAFSSAYRLDGRTRFYEVWKCRS